MATKIDRRFNVTNNILDNVAGKQTLSVPMILVDGPHTNGRRFNTVTVSDWKISYPDDTSAVYRWLETLFSNNNRPRTAVVVHRQLSETVAEAMDDAVELGADFYFVTSECTTVGQIVADGTVTITTPEVSQVVSLPGQSVSTLTVETVDSIAEQNITSVVEDNVDFTAYASL